MVVRNRSSPSKDRNDGENRNRLIVDYSRCGAGHLTHGTIGISSENKPGDGGGEKTRWQKITS